MARLLQAGGAVSVLDELADRLEAERLRPIPRLPGQRRPPVVEDITDDAARAAARQRVLVEAYEWHRRNRPPSDRARLAELREDYLFLRGNGMAGSTLTQVAGRMGVDVGLLRRAVSGL